MFLLTDFENLKIKSAKSAHRDMLYVFIRVSDHIYIYIYIYTVFLIKAIK
jgi:hypothetical protein